MTRAIFFGLFLVLASCTDRIHAPLVPAAANIGIIETVFVGTTRARDPAAYFDTRRSAGLQFVELDVSIPRIRQPGKIQVARGRTQPDPEKHFVLSRERDLSGDMEFSRRLAREIRSRPPNDREVTIYVHGYNNSFSDGVFRIAQLMHDLSLPGTAVHYSWPSAANPLQYAYDRDSALFSRDGLEALIRDVRSARPSRIILVGHSMGNMVIMETLRQIDIRTPGWTRKNLDGVIMISPDIDIDLFKSQARRFEVLPQPFAIFVNERDRALNLAARINSSRARLGTVNSANELADYPVTLVDVSDFRDSDASHFLAGTSQALIRLLSNVIQLDLAFQFDNAARAGFLRGSVLSVRNATQVILTPDIRQNRTQ